MLDPAQERADALKKGQEELLSERQYALMTRMEPSETVLRRIIRNLMLGSSNYGR